MEDFNIVTILGSGTSTGVPILGCKCDVCQSEMPKNKRFRTSILITLKSGKNVLVDTSPDLRSQALRANLTDVESCIITHSHADHCHGIDDLRAFTVFKNRSMNIHCSKHTAGELEIKFDYIFKKKVLNAGPIPLLELVIVDNMIETEVAGEKFTFFNLPHGNAHTTCFYTNGLAYIIDCSSIPSKIVDFLKSKNLELLIIDCNSKDKPHKTHLHLPLSLDYAKKINAKRTGLIHMSHVFEHHSFEQELKNQELTSIFPVYDEQKLEY
jgi:phosphoribosyl 1,2-cyclic phosphate phosphodiesterase